jgi:hypothetical protein
MSTKTALRLAAFAAFVAFWPVMMLGIMSMEWFLTGQSSFAQRFLSGNFGIAFCMWLFGLGTVAIPFVLNGLARVVRHAPNIDRLEDVIYNYQQARKQYQKATENLAQQTKVD